MSKRPHDAKGKIRPAARGSTAAVVWSLILVALSLGAYELISKFNSRPAQTNRSIAQSIDPDDHGTLIFKNEEGRCERMKYDETGHVIEPFRPCSNADLNLDEHGKPLPIGTMRRLDAIGSSFLGRKE